MAIKEITVSSWEEFEEKIKQETEKIEQLRNQNKGLHISSLLYRGQKNSSWKLETTLERYKKHEFSWAEYYKILCSLLPAMDVFTNHRYEPKKFSIDMSPVPPEYDFMVYLRHHGFPSPLLDWTRSPYIAAYFAFSEAAESESPSIFTLREYSDRGKGHIIGETEIHGLGPYIRNSHKRHYIQQCEYTLCYREERENNNTIKGRYYMPHQEADYSNEQNILCKYIFAHTEKKKVMNKLDQMNINAFTLFGNEEGLASMLAYREIETRF